MARSSPRRAAPPAPAPAPARAKAAGRASAGRAAAAPQALKAIAVPQALPDAIADSATPGSTRWSFDGVVRRVLGFSRAAEVEAAVPGRRAAYRAAAAVVAGEANAASPAFDALNVFVRSLDDETRGKLQTVMHAGREAQALPDAVTSLAAAPGAAAIRAADLFATGSAAFQDLQRGHAVACATAFDLELKLARWGKVKERGSLDERVWLRFGRELARSRVEEWSCHAVVDSREQLEKLYLRCGENPWWSFGALIDRPSARELGGLRAAKKGRSRVVSLSLQAALARSCRADLRAVHRASMAVSARLGMCGVSGGASSKPLPGKS